MNEHCIAVEFAVGDKVTYKPYRVAMELFVVKVTKGADFVQDDTRIFYHLASQPGFKPSTQSTGICIVESKYYIPSNWVLLDGDEIIERTLTQEEAEQALCRACNEGMDAYIREE